MKQRTGLVIAIAFASGFFFHLLVCQFFSYPVDDETDVSRHWKRWNEYLSCMNDPENHATDSDGLAGVIVPFDPKPHLAALVAAGELESISIVLPTVPVTRKTNLHWMRFVKARPETILYALGNHQYAHYSPSGEAPLQLHLWFRRQAQADIQRLIKELEALHVKE